MGYYEQVTGTFIGKGGIEIFFQKWRAPKSKHVIILSHGLGEHSGRYGNIINKFEGKGVSFYAIDHRGHGNSGGIRGHVDDFQDYLYDLKLFHDFTWRENPGATLTLCGHSLGGVIAARYVLQYPDDFNALILSSAGVLPAVEIPAWKEFLAEKLSRYAPTITMANGIDPAELSGNPETVKAYLDDPLVHDRASARFYTEFMRAGKDCLIRCYEFKLPLLIIHGKEDRIVSFLGSERIYENAASSHKEYHALDGLRHECMNEVPEGREKALSVIAAWFDRYILPMAKGIKKAKDQESPMVSGPVSKKTAVAAKKKSPVKKAVKAKAPSGKKQK